MKTNSKETTATPLGMENGGGKFRAPSRPERRPPVPSRQVADLRVPSSAATLAASPKVAPNGPLAVLRAELAEAQETLRAIRNGEVDAVVVADKKGPRVYTLEGPDQDYRELIESMNEGALTLTTDKMILYANACFAKMVQRPLEQVIGKSFREFLAEEDRQPLRALLRNAGKAGSKVQLVLHRGNGSQLPVLISVRPLAKQGGSIVTVGMVVTDMTEARRNEELLRGLSHRLVQAQETELGRVALELHDNITQLLCAILVRCQALANKLPAHDPAARAELKSISGLLGQNVDEVQRIGQNLRPSVLDHLGLVAVLRSDSAEFAKRTGVSLKLNCVELSGRLSAEAELAFYRILQEALKNVAQHARARHVTVHLTQPGDCVEMEIIDDGIGFDPDHPPARRKAKLGFGLVSMRERAACAGGTWSVKSAPGQGTTICAQIPLGKAVRGGADEFAETKFRATLKTL